MEQSLFIEFVDNSSLQTIADSTQTTINGSNAELTYEYKNMLSPRYEPTLEVSTLNSDTVFVGADIVATDTSLPLKTRDSVAMYAGTMPKIGLSFTLNESTFKKISIMRSMGNNSLKGQISGMIFQDPVRAIVGMHETVEFMFQEALSSGFTAIPAIENPGQSIRFNYGYPASNKFGVGKSWTDADADPIADIDNVLDKASEKGVNLGYIHMHKSTFNLFKNNTKVKEFYTQSVTKILISGTPLSAPSLQDINNALEAQYGVQIKLYNRKVTFEKNGIRTGKNPWETNSVIFTPSLNVGSFVFSDLPEATMPVKQATYATVDNWILISKYSETNPFKEFTTASGFGMPLIENVNSIFKMDVSEAVTDTQIEGDVTFIYKGASKSKTVVISALKLADSNITLTVNSTDAKIMKVINTLSDEQILIFEGNI